MVALTLVSKRGHALGCWGVRALGHLLGGQHSTRSTLAHEPPALSPEETRNGLQGAARQSCGGVRSLRPRTQALPWWGHWAGRCPWGPGGHSTSVTVAPADGPRCWGLQSPAFFETPAASGHVSVCIYRADHEGERSLPSFPGSKLVSSPPRTSLRVLDFESQSESHGAKSSSGRLGTGWAGPSRPAPSCCRVPERRLQPRLATRPGEGTLGPLPLRAVPSRTDVSVSR